MRIAEVYQSVQGEGFLTGTKSVFVRTSGCNLRCWYCDTPYTSWSPEGEDISVKQILAQVEKWDCHHVVLTGGEPMLYSELIPICQHLHGSRWHITVETAGTLYLPVDCDLMSISPKLANSTPSPEVATHWSHRHEQTRHAPDVVQRLVAEYTYQIKFVVDTPGDCDDTQKYLDEMPEIDRERVLLMPQGYSPEALAQRAEWLEPYCRQHGLQFCPRRQFEWFGAERGT